MKPDLKRVADQTIVITGASSGIGLVTARAAAERGARVVLAARSEEALAEIVAQMNRAGQEAEFVVADVSKLGDVRRIARQARKRFGGYDTWVNNAGVSIYGKLDEVPVKDQKRLFETNYWGVVHGSVVAVQDLRQRGGAIINVGSTLSDRAIPLQGTYCASKHAVKGFTDALRMELEHDEIPISVTLIKPAAIDTPYTEHAKNYMEVEPEHPAPVYAPEIVAEAILYAAENEVRDLFVGGGAKGLSAASYYEPGLTDIVMESLMFEAQKSDEPATNREENSLNRDSNDPRESGIYEGHVANSSLYTSATVHPLITGTLFLAGCGVAFALSRTSTTRWKWKS
jgi:short-subunit dehydrogenase